MLFVTLKGKNKSNSSNEMKVDPFKRTNEISLRVESWEIIFPPHAPTHPIPILNVTCEVVRF